MAFKCSGFCSKTWFGGIRCKVGGIATSFGGIPAQIGGNKEWFGGNPCKLGGIPHISKGDLLR